MRKSFEGISKGENYLIVLWEECRSEISYADLFPGLFLPVLGRAGDARGESEKPMGRRGVGELLSFPFFLATMWICVHLYFVGVHLYLHVYILNCFCILLLKALSSLEPS